MSSKTTTRRQPTPAERAAEDLAWYFNGSPEMLTSNFSAMCERLAGLRGVDRSDVDARIDAASRRREIEQRIRRIPTVQGLVLRKAFRLIPGLNPKAVGELGAVAFLLAADLGERETAALVAAGGDRMVALKAEAKKSLDEALRAYVAAGQ